MTDHKVHKIGVLTSGGDAPGMNAAIRAIVRTATHFGLDVVGFMKGYHGLVHNEYMELNNRSVSNTVQRGGTLLRSARCQEFRTQEGRQQAAQNLQQLGIDALLVIGGDGSLRGAHLLADEWSGQIIGLPGTIDNDLAGTDYTIGFFTALDTALDAIDKLRDTADAIDRVFVVEVMGRMAGFIAQGVGIGGGAEEIIVPEYKFDIDTVCEHIELARNKGKVSFIIVLAEGAYDGGAMALSQVLTDKTGIACRPCVLGYIQRGGSPAALDRILATKLGAYSVEAVLHGVNGVMVGLINKELSLTPLEKTWTEKKPLDAYLEKIQPILAQ
ncbi:6-phosphofructokinase [Kaarinaea lacus]